MGLSKIVAIFFWILATLGSSMAENYHGIWSINVTKSTSMKKVEVGDTHVIKNGPSSDTAILQEKKDDYESYKPSPPIASYNDKNNSANYSSDGENYFTSRKDHDDDDDDDDDQDEDDHKRKHDKHHKGQMCSCSCGAPSIPDAPMIPNAPSIPTSDCSTRDTLGLTFILVGLLCFL